MTCTEVKTLISPYLDGRAGSSQMQALSQHISDCAACAREYVLLRLTQNAVAGLGRKQPPPELTLRLNVMVSHQVADRRKTIWSIVQSKLENVVDAVMVPATAGAFSAFVIFGLLIGFLAVPNQLRAYNDDVPTVLYTPPQLMNSPFSCSFSSKSEGTGALVIEAAVDEFGRVQDYKILSSPSNYHKEKMTPRLENMLIFTTFQPARTFGRPIAGRAILTFSKVNVRG